MLPIWLYFFFSFFVLQTYFSFQNMSKMLRVAGFQIFFLRAQYPPISTSSTFPCWVEPTSLNTLVWEVDMPVDETATGNVMDSCSAGHSQAVILANYSDSAVDVTSPPTHQSAFSLPHSGEDNSSFNFNKLSGKLHCSQSASQTFHDGLTLEKVHATHFCWIFNGISTMGTWVLVKVLKT